MLVLHLLESAKHSVLASKTVSAFGASVAARGRFPALKNVPAAVGVVVAAPGRIRPSLSWLFSAGFFAIGFALLVLFAGIVAAGERSLVDGVIAGILNPLFLVPFALGSYALWYSQHFGNPANQGWDLPFDTARADLSKSQADDASSPRLPSAEKTASFQDLRPSNSLVVAMAVAAIGVFLVLQVLRFSGR